MQDTSVTVAAAVHVIMAHIKTQVDNQVVQTVLLAHSPQTTTNPTHRAQAALLEHTVAQRLQNVKHVVPGHTVVPMLQNVNLVVPGHTVARGRQDVNLALLAHIKTN